MRLGVRKSNLLGVAAVAFIAMGAAGCSSLPSVPDWVDPTSWFGDDNASSADSAQTPDLASIPDKPASSTPDDQKQVAESLASDRSHAQYSADALRAGTEPAAPPPPDVAATPAATADADLPKPKAAAAAPPPVRVASVDRSIAQEPSGAAVPGALPATAAGTPVAVAATAPASDDTVKTADLPEPPAAPEPVKPQRRTRMASVAPVAPPPGAQGALPPTPAVPVQTAMINPSDAELGFKPSSAPPLDPSVSQFVPSQILDRYRQTAAGAGVRASGGVSRGYAAAAKPRRVARAATGLAVGGPEKMSGNVTANFDALQTPTAPSAAQAVYADPNGMPATAVVFFPNDTVALSEAAKAQVEATAEQYKAAGGRGYIRVVGHSSSRTPNMSGEKHLEIIFRKSQDRANAVAQELIREGVPADKVLVEAVGDTQPVYYESMPKGEDGNRRAEIFFQG